VFSDINAVGVAKEISSKREKCHKRCLKAFRKSKDKYSKAKQDFFKIEEKIQKRKAELCDLKLNLAKEKAFSSLKEKTLSVYNDPKSIGIDFGCGYGNTLTLSDGEVLALPPSLYLETASLERLKSLYNAKPNNNSKRAIKLKEKIRIKEDRVVNIRMDFCHKVTKYLLSKYDTIYCEDISSSAIAEDAPSHFIAKQIHNAAFGRIKNFLKYKAEIAGNLGKRVEFIDPAGTSQFCPCCLLRKRKKLSERTHKCNKCGLKIDRDLCSAILIKKIGDSKNSPDRALDRAFGIKFYRLKAIAFKRR
jgi:IS605 OrfB family transposase